MFALHDLTLFCFHLYPFQHVEFGMRLATCLGLDGTVSELLTGEFACDAVITRAQQLVRQEVRSGSECA